MRNIDEDNITQAVIARHAATRDHRVREVMTSLVQHLHAFAREVRLSEAEWAEGIRFLAECGERTQGRRQEFALLSDTLGLSMLVTALNHRKPQGCTESTVSESFHDLAVRRGDGGVGGVGGATLIGLIDAAVQQGHVDETAPCHVTGRVRALDGTPVAGAEVQVWPAGAHASEPAPRAVVVTDADGGFRVQALARAGAAVPHDGPVGRMLQALGRHPWRPAHLHFTITAPGYQRLDTQVFRQGDPHLDSDAVFGVRSSLVADWVPHAPGRMPDGTTGAVPFATLDFTFVLNAITTAGDRP